MQQFKPNTLLSNRYLLVEEIEFDDKQGQQT